MADYLSLLVKKMISTKIIQFNLVKFPILFPLVYGILLYSFPNFEKELILITILLLAETHFGATWPFFINKNNFAYLKEKRIELIIIPAMISIFSLIGFIYFKSLFLLIFFIVNIYHVTRQSYGICKLYCKNEQESKFQSNVIYIFNLFFFLIAFFRFYIPIIQNDYLIFLNIFIIFLLLLTIFYYFKKFGLSENIFVFITGCIIFLPASFVSNPIHVILMGVTMHYTQYLYFTTKVNKLRIENFENDTKKIKNKSFYFIFAIIIYASIMTFFSSMGKLDNETYKSLIFIPILGQMLHFYIDSQIWKFREKHNRDYTLKYLNQILN